MSSAPHGGEAIVQLTCRLVGTDGHALGEADGAGVELLLDAHDRDTGLGIAGEKSPLDRRGTRQRGRSEAWMLKQPWRGASRIGFGRIIP